MATPKTIPSRVSGGPGVTTAPVFNHLTKKEYLYITAIITNGALSIDSVPIGTPGPVSLSSPISCTSFTTVAAGQVAYYIQ